MPEFAVTAILRLEYTLTTTVDAASEESAETKATRVFTRFEKALTAKPPTVKDVEIIEETSSVEEYEVQEA